MISPENSALRAALSAPFSPEDLDFVAVAQSPPRSSGNKPTDYLYAAYIDARAVMDRLDDVVGPGNWCDHYSAGPLGGMACTLSLRIEDEWVGKTDGAPPTDIEPVKGAFSAALVRAAVKWGIGRYLYDLPKVWLPVSVKHDDVAAEVAKKLGTKLTGVAKPESGGPTPLRARLAEPAPGAAPRSSGTEVEPSSAWDKAFASLVGSQDIDYVDIATFLGCPIPEVFTVAAKWCRDERKTQAALLSEVRRSMAQTN